MKNWKYLIKIKINSNFTKLMCHANFPCYKVSYPIF